MRHRQKRQSATNSGMSCARVMRVVIARHQPLHRPGWRTRREGPGSQCAEQLQSRPGPLCETAPTRSGGASPLLPAQIQNEAANKRSPGRCPPRLPAAGSCNSCPFNGTEEVVGSAPLAYYAQGRSQDADDCRKWKKLRGLTRS